MDNTIILAELQMQGEKHVHVNSGLLQIVQNTFDSKNIKVYCDNVHKDALLKNVPAAKEIQFNTFDYAGDKEFKKIYTLNKLLRETVLAYRIFKRAQTESTNVIIFASGHPFTALIFNLFSILFKQVIIVCLHGELGVLALKTNKITTNVFAYAVKSFFKNQGNLVITLFYGDSIKSGLYSLLPVARKKNSISIDHPYTYKGRIKETAINQPIVIASIGTGRIKKNSHFIYKLAEQCVSNIDSNKLKIIQIGDISDEVLMHSNKLVTNIGYNKGFIKPDVFESALFSANYFIYFFTDNSLYDLSPSGSFFDSIKYQTPIIALHNPFFDYYFEKLGNIGYLCDSIDEMSHIINEISELKRIDEYNKQIENLLKAQIELSIKNISSSFSKQYKELTIKLRDAV